MTRFTFALLLSLSFTVACGSSRGRGSDDADAATRADSGAGDSGMGGDSGTAADGSVTIDGGPVITDGGPVTDAGPASCDFVETLEQGCTNDDSCVVGIHQTDCCGNTIAIGIDHSERDRFDAAEAACRTTYPLCGCPAGPTVTDSGETAFDADGIRVACVSDGPTQVCRTYVTMRPEDTP